MKRPLTDAIVDMVDIKGEAGVDLALARLFFACSIPFDVACYPSLSKWCCAIGDGFAGYKAP